MHAVSRRGFLGTSFGGMAAALGAGPVLLAAEPKKAAGFAPDTLFLTWQRDPTTTMTVQWVGKETTQARTHVECALDVVKKGEKKPEANEEWLRAKLATKPFPLTEQKVFRA